jgi:hypothetical protein
MQMPCEAEFKGVDKFVFGHLVMEAFVGTMSARNHIAFQFSDKATDSMLPMDDQSGR